MYTALNPYVLPSLLARLLDRFKLGYFQFMRTKLASGLATARSRFIPLPKFLHCSPNSRQPFSAAVTSYNNLLFSFMDTVELSSLRLSYGNLSRRKYLPFLTLDTFQQFKPFTLIPLAVIRLFRRKSHSALERRISSARELFKIPHLKVGNFQQEMSMCRTVATAFVWSQDQTLVFSFSSSRGSDQLPVVNIFQGTDSNRQQWMMRPVSYLLLHPEIKFRIKMLQGWN
jgi:hypothetical protein